MMVDREQDLGLSLSINSSQEHNYRFPLQLTLMPCSNSSTFNHHSDSQWNNLLAPPSGERGLREIDVNRPPTTERESEEEAGASSPNSTVSSVSGKRGMSEREAFQNGDEHNEIERGINSDEEDGEGSRKKLRLSKDQSAILEDSFKEHSTLNPKQKLALARQLNLRPRQDEVEADGSRLRISKEMLRKSNRGEPASTKRSSRTTSFEAVSSVLHAHDTSDHANHVPVLRACIIIHRCCHHISKSPPSDRHSSRTVGSAAGFVC